MTDVGFNRMNHLTMEMKLSPLRTSDPKVREIRPNERSIDKPSGLRLGLAG